ncbi:FaeA/PapI family transcriptional regulator [Caldivirga sp.]|uniref:FaeA/PapI family transcriptional regulator n=1 Tax=Caldivirga sp. TaxID=2080243 RepID=UPI0025C330A0|nr:FaeA/PapI family transcriptional regulator [Caldivirga sp.]
MPRKQTNKILERKNDILDIIRKKGEISTNDLVKTTGLSHSQVFYILRLLQRDGAIREIKRGKVAYWRIVEQKQEAADSEDTDVI